MYFWNIEALKKDIVKDRLTEKERFVYVLIYLVLTAVGFEYLQQVDTELANIWDSIEAIADVLIVLIGTYCAYRANGGENGQDFLGRYFSIGFVVSIRFFVYLIPIVILLSIYFVLSFPDSEVIETTPLEVSVLLAWNCCLYANIVRHLKAVKNTLLNTSVSA